MTSLVFFIESISTGLYIIGAGGVLWMAYRFLRARRDLTVAQFDHPALHLVDETCFVRRHQYRRATGVDPCEQLHDVDRGRGEIGRASCRERV